MDRMSSYEFAESLAFERLEPDPAEMTMHLMAALLTITANVNRDIKSKPVAYTVDDFLPNPYAPSKAEREAAFAATMAEFAKQRAAKLEKPQ
jgi:hypothetical protein